MSGAAGPAGAARPQDVQAAFAAVLVDEWARAGVRDVVVCPGSRSTPLLLALDQAAGRGALRLHFLLDERSAGFFALGLGLAGGRPAAVVTTSGTAAAELHPAVMEAHHAGVPLLAVTADRPPDLHGCGASQTADQDGLYGAATRWEPSLGVPDLAWAGSWRSLASRSVAEALGGVGRPGPVHLNLAFREPLVGQPESILAGPALAGRPGGAPWHARRPSPGLGPPPEVLELLEAAGDRGLIVAGPGAGEASAVWALSQAAGWPVIADFPSGCRWPGAVGAADAIVRSPFAARLEPTVVLRLGAPPVSRALAEWLGALGCPQVLVDRWGTWAAPDRRPEEVVVADPSALCLALASRLGPGRGRTAWAEPWSWAEAVAQAAIDAVLAEEAGLNEPAVVRQLVDQLPEGADLVVSASMPVRELEWWSRPRRGLRVLFNRGVNGIDGVLSTALGVAAAGGGTTSTVSTPAHSPQAPVVALVGDLAFLYDVGALAYAARRGLDLVVVVLDNDGGGIFSFLPQAAQPHERFERLWGTPHGLDLVAVARGFGVAAEELADLGQLAKAVVAPPGGGTRVLVARSDRAASVAVHQRLWAAVSSALLGTDQSG